VLVVRNIGLRIKVATLTVVFVKNDQPPTHLSDLANLRIVSVSKNLSHLRSHAERRFSMFRFKRYDEAFLAESLVSFG